MAVDFSDTLLFEGNIEVGELKTQNKKLSTLNIVLYACLVASFIIIIHKLNPQDERIKIIL